VRVPGAAAAGEVELALDHVAPLPVQGLPERPVARLEIKIGDAGREIERADGVALDRRGFAYGHTVLEGDRAVVAARPEPSAPAVREKDGGELELPRPAGLAGRRDARRRGRAAP